MADQFMQGLGVFGQIPARFPCDARGYRHDDAPSRCYTGCAWEHDMSQVMNDIGELN